MENFGWSGEQIISIHTQLYDISKFFDIESLRDGMNSIYNCGIQGKLYRLIYNLNKDTKIKLKKKILVRILARGLWKE